MATDPHPSAPRPGVRRDWTCLVSALILLLICATLTLGGYWIATFRLHSM